MKTIRSIILAVSLAFAGLTGLYAGGNEINEKDELNPDMKLEQWMMVITEFESGLDAEMNFERWMLSQLAFMDTENFTDESLEIENWMTSPFDVDESTIDSELQLENWMIHYSGLEVEKMDQEMELETWMMGMN